MSDSNPEFRDPVLKASIRRALGAELASPALRGRISAALDDAFRDEWTNAGNSIRGKPTSRFGWRSLAVAASLLIAVGCAYLLLFRSVEGRAPAALVDAMLSAHSSRVEGRANSDELLPGSLLADRKALRKELERRAHHPVLVADIGDGWRLNSAGMCKVGDQIEPQLTYTRGTDVISLFSVAIAPFNYGSTAASYADYSEVAFNHPISGFVQGSEVHCLVATSKDGSLTLRQLRRIRDSIRPQLDEPVTMELGGSCHPVQRPAPQAATARLGA